MIKFLTKRTLVLAALLGTLAAPAFAEDKLSIIFDESNPPYMHGQGGEAHGIYPAIVRVAFAKMNTPVDLSSLPWGRAVAGADEGKSGIGGLYKNKDREAKYDFSAPLYQEKILVYTLADKSFPYATLDDLKDKTIGVVRGWSYGDAFDTAKKEGKFKTEEANSDELNIKKLGAGRIDAVIASPEAADPVLKKEGLEGRVKPLTTPVTTNDTFIAFNKMAKKTDLLKKFDETLAAMKADGSYEKAKTTEK